MSDRLDHDTAERMLCGEDAGPGGLAALLSAMSATPLRDDPRGEEAAVAAFRRARAGTETPVVVRGPWRSRLLAVKAALAGLLLILAGGVAVAASPHLPRSLGKGHASATPTLTAPRRPMKHLTVLPPPHTSSPTRAPSPRRAPHARRHGHQTKKPHPKTPSSPPGKGPKGNSKSKPQLKVQLPPGLGRHGPPLTGTVVPGEPLNEPATGV